MFEAERSSRTEFRWEKMRPHWEVQAARKLVVGEFFKGITAARERRVGKYKNVWHF